jgi:hypothetical protein
MAGTMRESYSTKAIATKMAKRWRELGWKVSIVPPRVRDINGMKGSWWIVGKKK